VEQVPADLLDAPLGHRALHERGIVEPQDAQPADERAQQASTIIGGLL
jgi:hypothetical protein